jgi:3-phosphoshikimate 1-carboxyvinyltransferase
MKENYVKIPKIDKKPNATIKVPGSKSITQRALVIASLSDGKSVLLNPLVSEDTMLLADALDNLGIMIKKLKDKWIVNGRNGNILPYNKELYMGNNGTGIRVLCSIVSLGSGKYTLTGTKRMEERPVKPLLDALNQLGIEARSIKNNDCPPVEIITNGLQGGRCNLSANLSSQYLSSLLLVAPCVNEEITIDIIGELTSKPYIHITTGVMKAFDINVIEKGNSFTIPLGHYRATEYPIEGDASGASYFFALAAITGGTINISNMPRFSLQGDAHFTDILKEMGCSVTKGIDGVTVAGNDGLKGIDIDMSNWPDIVPTLAVVAAFANGTTRITNVPHLRIKETDRLKAVAAELTKIGVNVQELDDGLVIEGMKSEDKIASAVIKTYDDHRIAMAFSLAGLKIPDITIENPDCVAKSFPNYWDVFFDVIK